MKMKNQNGFTLISVMVAASITAIISLSVATMITNMTRGQNAVAFKNEADTVTEEIRTTLAVTNACKNSMGGIVLATGSTSDVVAVKDVLNNPVFQKATTLNTRGMRIDTMTLGGYTDLVNQTGKATLTVEYTSTREVLGPRTFYRVVNISTLKDASDVLVDCIATSGGSAGTNTWSLAANLSDIMFTGGNVGIGTPAAADSKLLVSGAGDVTSTVSSSDSGAAIINLIGSQAKITRSAGPFSVFAGGVNQFTILNNGNVGIGTANASEALEVAGPGDVTSLITSGAGNVAELKMSGGSGRVSSSNGPLSLETATADSIVMKISGAEQMSIRSSGFVGIGTTNPSTKLEVSGSGTVVSKITSATSGLSQLDLSGGSGAVSSAAGSLTLETRTPSSISMKTNNAERMSISATGAVGIGTNSPAAGTALDVKGGFIRGQMECRLVSGAMTIFPSEANCAGDEFVMSGGMNCRDPMDFPVNGGYIHQSQPKPDMSGWIGDCYNAGYADPQTPGQAFAICCKK